MSFFFRLCPSHVAMPAEVEGVAKVSVGWNACADMDASGDETRCK
ncbi:hypothetical protein [Hoylesella buccalis]|nr:hypothetical protein [Hoylesella buccalis]